MRSFESQPRGTVRPAFAERLASVESVGAALHALAGTRVDAFHVDGFLDQLTGYCVDLLDISAAGVMLADAAAGGGGLRLLAASGEDSRRLQLAELDRDDGPSVEAYRRGHVTGHHRFDPGEPRWAGLARIALSAGFRGSHAITMRHGDLVIGVLSLFRRSEKPLSHGDQRLGQMLAGVATMSLLRSGALAAHRPASVAGGIEHLDRHRSGPADATAG